MTMRLSFICLVSHLCVLVWLRGVTRVWLRLVARLMMILCRRVVILLRRLVSTRLLRVVKVRLLCLRNLNRLNILRRIRGVRRFDISLLIVLGVLTMLVI